MKSLAGEDLWLYNGSVRPVLTLRSHAVEDLWFFNGPVRLVLTVRSWAGGISDFLMVQFLHCDPMLWRISVLLMVG